jgi:hypothetical protein
MPTALLVADVDYEADEFVGHGHIVYIHVVDIWNHNKWASINVGIGTLQN